MSGLEIEDQIVGDGEEAVAGQTVDDNGTIDPLTELEEVDIHKLQFERFVAFEKGVPTRDWIDGMLNQYNVVVRPVMEFDNIETIKRAVEINAGVSILPRVTIPVFMFNGRYDSFFPTDTSIRPFFENLGTPAADKKLTITDSNHFVAAYSNNQLISESLDWLDRYLGPVK